MFFLIDIKEASMAGEEKEGNWEQMRTERLQGDR